MKPFTFTSALFLLFVTSITTTTVQCLAIPIMANIICPFGHFRGNGCYAEAAGLGGFALFNIFKSSDVANKLKDKVKGLGHTETNVGATKTLGPDDNQLKPELLSRGRNMRQWRKSFNRC